MQTIRVLSTARAKALAALIVVVAAVVAGCGGDGDPVAFEAPVGTAALVDAEAIEFAEVSPFARFGPAIGDFTMGEHGTFGIFNPGAASPPHTHSGSYYAVVLGGEMSNPFGTEADPPALPPGSFWSVPAGEQHVTACLSADSECSFFFHAADAFDFAQIDGLTDGRSADARAVPAGELVLDGLEPYAGAATVWGDRDNGPYGMIVRVESGATTSEMAHRGAFTLVPTVGALAVELDAETIDVSVGSLLEVEANTPHGLACQGEADCLAYIYSETPLDLRTG